MKANILYFIVQCSCGLGVGLAVKEQNIVLAAIAIFILQTVTRMQALEDGARLAAKREQP
jgi:hypothetical protein